MASAGTVCYLAEADGSCKKALAQPHGSLDLDDNTAEVALAVLSGMNFNAKLVKRGVAIVYDVAWPILQATFRGRSGEIFCLSEDLDLSPR